MRSLLLQGFFRLFGYDFDYDSSYTSLTPQFSELYEVGSALLVPTPSQQEIIPPSSTLSHSSKNGNVTDSALAKKKVEFSSEVSLQDDTCFSDDESILSPGDTSLSDDESILSRSTATSTSELTVERRVVFHTPIDQENNETLDNGESSLEGTVTSLLRRFCHSQAVVIGKLPSLLPKGHVYVISGDQDVPPYCWHVRCTRDPGEWPTALALMGFDWRESTVWLLQMQDASDDILVRQMKAVAMMSAPCSVVLLISLSAIAVKVANEVGFSMGVEQHGKPLYLLRKKVRHARWDGTDSPLPEPSFDGWVVRFDLDIDEMAGPVRDMLVGGCGKVVGSCKALGEWDIKRGVLLEDACGTLIAEVLVERSEKVEYKYVVESRDGLKVWEEGENRYFPDIDGISIWLEDKWGS